MFNNEQNGQGNTFKDDRRALLTNIVILLSFIIPLNTISLFSQAEGGGFSQAYMFRSAGGRAGGMSGAYTAVVNDPYAIYYNPAGLAFLEYNPAIIASVQTSGYGKTYNTLVYGQEIMPNIGFGIGINNFNGGSFMARDYKGNPLGEFSDLHYGVNVGASYSMDFMALGVALKYLNNTLLNSDYSAHGFGMDVGLKANLDFGNLGSYSFGASVQNIGGMMLWDDKINQTDMIPYCVRLGVGMELGLNSSEIANKATVTGENEIVSQAATRYILIGLDAVFYQFDVYPTYLFGFDAVVHELVSFRGGIALWGENQGKAQFFPMTIWSGGFAVKPNAEVLGLPFDLNISYTISNEYVSYSGIGHQVSLMFSFK